MYSLTIAQARCLTGIPLQIINCRNTSQICPGPSCVSDSGMYSSDQHQDHTTRDRNKPQS